MASTDLLSAMSLALNIQIECSPDGEEEARGILSSTPAWFWQSSSLPRLRFEPYERTRARNLAESLWRGDDPFKLNGEVLTVFLGDMEAKPARLAFFAVLDSLALNSWLGADSELRNAWAREIESLPLSYAIFDDGLGHQQKLIRLWTVAWRFAGHREYEWMEHQLSTVPPSIRDAAKTILIKLIPELSPESPLWEATRYGLRQDARTLHQRLMKEMEKVDPLPQRDANRRRKRQSDLGQIFARFADLCATCSFGGGSCCSRDIPHYYFSKLDLAFLKGCGVPLPDFEPAYSSNNSCIFLNADGCRFPAEYRPAVCISHTCDSIYESLTQKEKSLLTRFELRRLMSVQEKGLSD